MVRPGRERLHGIVEVDEAYWGGEEEEVRGRQTYEKALIAVAAEADGTKIGRIRLRHIPVSVWHLLMGHFTPLLEVTEHLRAKLLRLATLIGKAGIKALGFDDRDAVVDAQIRSIQLSP